MGDHYRIRDLFDLRMGRTPARKETRYWTDCDADWVSIRDLSGFGKYVGKTKERINQTAIEECRMDPVPADTLIMSFKLSIGKTAITKKPVYTNEAIMAFLDKHTVPLDLDYLYHQFSSKDWMESSNLAVMGATLNKKTLGEKTIVVPSIEEQRRVSRRLECVQNQMSLVRRILAKTDELVQSRFVEMFGSYGEETTRLLGEVAVVQTGATPSRANAAYYGDGIPWVKTGEINYTTIMQSAETISAAALRETNCKLFPAGTILIAMYGQGDTRGRAGVLGIPAATNQACAAVLLDVEQCDNLFMLQQLRMKYDELRGLSLGGNQKNLSLGIIKAMPVVLPPIELQREFAAFVRQVESLKTDLNHEVPHLKVSA